ncbi:hypothetical protein N8K70_03750 [Microbacterium betulae]|uniref:Uncharacterized protein n=1 Tax=Microbacterium betulae TaxID=2981139 RepID=A0AA97I6F6_9MICO|nr:hypothetical protein [Microbacterium sp. AB]WOF23804.1 hypothetical protein N8K70_03750 [Microbacterium sp. AB]
MIAQGVGVRTLREATGANVDHLIYGYTRRDGTRAEQKLVTARVARTLAGFTPTLDHYAAHAVIDGRGTRRRLRALAAMGWSFAVIGRHLGRIDTNVARLARARRVTAGTAREVRDLYEVLSVTPAVGETATERAMIARTKRHARDRGWHGPLAWDDVDTDPELPSQSFVTDDELDLELDLAALLEQHRVGTPARLRGEELHRVVHAFAERGELTHREIAEVVGCAEKTVDRLRAAARAAARVTEQEKAA